MYCTELHLFSISFVPGTGKGVFLQYSVYSYIVMCLLIVVFNLDKLRWYSLMCLDSYSILVNKN